MAFKKHNWMTFSREGKIIELAIEESDNRRLDFFRSNNQKEITKISGIVKKKYGVDLSPEINHKDSKNFKDELKEEEEFLNKEFNAC